MVETQAVPVRTSGRAWRKPPRSLAEFYDKYRGKPPDNRTLERALAVASEIQKLASSTKGGSVHFLFPLTSSAAVGEVFKGALSVLAPPPRTRVTFLATPRSAGRLVTGDEWNKLPARLKRAIPPDTTRILVVDLYDYGQTLEGIRNAAIVGLTNKRPPVASCPIDEIAFNVDQLIPPNINATVGVTIRRGLKDQSLAWRKRNDGTPFIEDVKAHRVGRRVYFDLGKAIAAEFSNKEKNR